MPMTRTSTPEVIAIAGAGDLGRYVCEELLKSTSFVPIILSRGVRSPTPLSIQNYNTSVVNQFPMLSVRQRLIDLSL